MASGYIKQVFATGYTLQVKWEETSVDVNNNKSTVKCTAQLVTAPSYNIISSVSKDISITCNGSTQSGSCYIAIDGNQTKNLMTATFTVPHNADGTKTVAISCTCWVEATLRGTYYAKVTASGNANLDTIARSPNPVTTFNITAGSGNYVGLGDTITLAWSGASGTITGYELQYSYGNSGWQSWKTVTGTSTTVSFAGRTDINQTGAGKAIKYRVRAVNGTFTSAWKESNTLYMVGGMDLKVGSTWQNGTVWIKVNNEWQRAKRVWIKINGTWQYSK